MYVACRNNDDFSIPNRFKNLNIPKKTCTPLLIDFFYTCTIRNTEHILSYFRVAMDLPARKRNVAPSGQGGEDGDFVQLRVVREKVRPY